MADAPDDKTKAPKARPIPWPATRPLRIYTTDPTRGYEAARKTSIGVDYELLKPGPIGDRIEVVDYDGHIGAYYHHVDLDDPAILMQGGLEPSEADPRFHQQMVYAVASRTLANFDRALGRRISMRRGQRHRRLRILPHAFRGRNAFYDRDLHALLFGYFEAEAENVGTNMRGQTIYTCLSHDIIAHEMTHAILDRVKRYFLEPTNPDTQAFHEGFSDLVALFQHFSFPDLVAAEIRRSRADLREPSVLVDLARQFGDATGEGKALRSAVDKPGGPTLADADEAHDRGAVLVAAVFDGFLTTYTARTRDLILIATDGRGELPSGDLSPYLADRLAMEASRIAQSQLNMCIRAIDYLPPVDVTFGDYLRALVTADFILNPDDGSGQRAALIEGCRKRGIHAKGVISLAEESLRWPVADDPPEFPEPLKDLLARFIAAEAASSSRTSTDPRLYSRIEPPEMPIPPEDRVGGQAGAAPTSEESLVGQVRKAMAAFIETDGNRPALFLHPGFPVYVYSVNAAFRAAPNGQPVIEVIVQLVQNNPKGARDEVLQRDIQIRGGTTLIIGADLRVKYAIARPLPGDYLEGSLGDEAPQRVGDQLVFTTALDARDPLFPYMSKRDLGKRMEARMSLRGLHRGRR